MWVSKKHECCTMHVSTTPLPWCETCACFCCNGCPLAATWAWPCGKNCYVGPYGFTMAYQSKEKLWVRSRGLPADEYTKPSENITYPADRTAPPGCCGKLEGSPDEITPKEKA